MQQYSTKEVADIIGIHPNTVRLYEASGLITKPLRQKNGYRIFSDLHIMQFKLARAAFQIEVLQNGLRKEVVEIVKVTAAQDFDKALKLTEDYLRHIQKEKQNAEEALLLTKSLLLGEAFPIQQKEFKRKEAALYLGVTIDTLRNWELNGLVEVKRKANGYRVYTMEDMKRLKIIRTLRCANYSLEAILRMLHALSKDPDVDIRQVIDTPNMQDDEEIISVCDKLLSSLDKAEQNAQSMKKGLKQMKQLF